MSESTGKHRRKVGIGYSVPASITLLTLIAELALSRCAWGKPRFGEESCFFAGIHLTMVEARRFLAMKKFQLQTIRARSFGFMLRLLSCSCSTHLDVSRSFAFFVPMKTASYSCICENPRSDMKRWIGKMKQIVKKIIENQIFR